MYSIPLDILFVRYNGMAAYDVYVRLKYTILLENYFSLLLIIKISCIRYIYIYIYILLCIKYSRTCSTWQLNKGQRLCSYTNICNGRDVRTTEKLQADECL